MAQQGTSDPHGDPNYRETADPENPPNAVMQPKVGMAAWGLFMGSVLALFAIVALVYLVLGREPAVEEGERNAVGTAGERSPGRDLPGGSNPEPRFGSTKDEIEYRGANQRPSAAPIDDLRALGDEPGRQAGRRVEVKGVTVESVDGSTFQVREGDARAVVVAPSGSAMPRAGQRVDIAGTVEEGDSGAVRIRAERIDARP